MTMMVELSEDSAEDYSDEEGWQIINKESSASLISTTSTISASPAEQPVIYLNNASQARLCEEAKMAGIDAIQESGLISGIDDDQQRVRELFAQIIQAGDDEDNNNNNDGKHTNVAIMPSTAFAITFAAKNIQRTSTNRSSGRIVLLQDQHNSAVYPWQQICNESNGKMTLDIVPHPKKSQSNNWTESILKRLDGSVIATCLPPLHWSDGTLIDLQVIKNVCVKFDIMLIVDGTQVQPAMLACSVHKWLRGPPGISLVYISPELHDEWQPLDFHGRGRDFPGGKHTWNASIDEIGPKGYPERYYADARKFDSGGKANPVLLPVLRAAMEQVALLDFHQSQNRLQMLIGPLVEWVKQHGNGSYSLPLTPHASHLIGIKPLRQTPQETIRFCDKLKKQHDIVVAVKCGCIRISPYLDTTETDISKLVAALDEEEKRHCQSHQCSCNGLSSESVVGA